MEVVLKFDVATLQGGLRGGVEENHCEEYDDSFENELAK